MRFSFIILCALFCLLTPVYAQSDLHKQTLEHVLNAPNSRTLSSLTYYLTKPYRNDYSKARAIAYYIASHIAYDEYLFNNGKKTPLSTQKRKPDDILQSRVGICSDFALLFTKMCQIAGIRAQTVHGNIFDLDERMRVIHSHNPTQHAWNYFEYRGRKVFVDTTFMAGGTTGYDSYVTDIKHRRAVDKLKKENNTYSVNPYYFDFDPKQEAEQRHKKRVSRTRL